MQDAIDVVITWVDGADPAHAAKRARYQGGPAAPEDATRFASRDEIRYCLLSILKYAPFVRRIHVVTDQQTPAALADIAALNIPGHQKIRLVDHAEIFRGHEDLLPTFNSIAIESMLFRIEGLAEQFVIFNDDMLLTAPVQPQDWFQNGEVVLRGVWFGLGLSALGLVRTLARHLPGLRRKASRFSNKAAYRQGARAAGFGQRTLVLAHAPYPLRKSRCAAVMQADPQTYLANAAHRFRSADQFNVISLISHSEIATAHPVLRGEADVVYLRADRDSPRRVSEKLARVAAGDSKFLCIQSLDQANPTLAALLSFWLETTYPAR